MSYRCRTESDLNNETKGHRESDNMAVPHHRSLAWSIFEGCRRVRSFGNQQILAILCRANSANITKDLRKVLLGLEATGHGHVQYSRTGSTQHRFSTPNPLTQDKLVRGLAN